MSAASFNQRINSLPQELYDMIFDYTFAADVSKPVIIKKSRFQKSYNPPACLQVSRATRDTFAWTYYTNSVFQSRSKEDLCDWIKSLQTSHQRMIMSLRYDLEFREPMQQSHATDYVRACFANKQLILFEEELDKLQTMRLELKPGEGGPDVMVSVRFHGEYELLWTDDPRSLHREWLRREKPQN